MSESSESISAPPSDASGQAAAPPPMPAPPMAPPQSPSQLPPTSVYPTAQPGYAQNPGYPPNASYTPYQSYGYPYPVMPIPGQQLPRGMAITGMVLGIVGLCTSIFYVGGVIGIVGLIFSIIAIRAAGRGQASGRGMAIAGLVTSIIGIVINAIEIVLIVWVVHTANNCSQYQTDPNATVAQYNACVRQGILGN